MKFFRTATEALYRLKAQLDYKYFDFGARRIVHLETIDTTGSDDFCVLSMVCKRDFFQYLLAIFSFTEHVVPGRIIVLNDGSLGRKEIDLLKRLINGIEVYPGNAYIDQTLPTYTSWQRIQAISEFVKESYVIQLDADILTRNSIEEVVQFLEFTQPFILGTLTGQRIAPAEQAREFALKAYEKGNRHVQCLCEKELNTFAEYPNMKYVRGCAGFAGFPKNSFAKRDLKHVSSVYSKVYKEQWPVWGSEQVTSNIILSNLPNAQVLPIKYYDSSERYSERLKLVHFIGGFRFTNGIYNAEAKRFIAGRAT